MDESRTAFAAKLAMRRVHVVAIIADRLWEK
jgi:hypothetical protein